LLWYDGSGADLVLADAVLVRDWCCAVLVLIVVVPVLIPSCSLHTVLALNRVNI
jgi:hypothetical protein